MIQTLDHRQPLGTSATRSFGVKAVRSAATLLSVLHADRAILNSIRFRPGFVDSDHALRAFADQVNRMEVER